MTDADQPADNGSERLRALTQAAQEFVARVERGEVRSQHTYMAFKRALAIPPHDPVAERLDRVDAGLATQLRRSIERNAQLHERLAEIRRYVEQWLAAYPLKVFPEPDLEKVAKVLKDNDLTLDAVSANMGRHVLTRLLEFINQPSTAA